MITIKQIQEKANRTVDLYLPLNRIEVNQNVSMWVNTCDNIRKIYPRRGNLRLQQLDKL